jgi:hypothetical protein
MHSWAGQQESVLLLLTDSVFEPEDWSRTFLEGCLRRPASGWKDAEVMEVGTGCVSQHWFNVRPIVVKRVQWFSHSVLFRVFEELD